MGGKAPAGWRRITPLFSERAESRTPEEKCVRWGAAHCRAMPAMRTEVQITGLRKEGDFSHDPIFNGGHGPRRPAASRPRNARGKERKKKKESDRGE